ncbi:MAG: DUF4369 domain-containing protein [Bacteroidales bacterium]|jgi:hypothetical protein|nr:DUF4369 domain-containing protein [Bacteroidales bacterium]
MKKITIITLAIIAIISACSGVGKDEFKVTGKLEYGQDAILYLADFAPMKQFTPTDTIRCDKDGRFSFTKKLSKDRLIFILYSNPDDRIILIPKRRENIILNASYKNLSSSYEIQNSKESVLLKKLKTELDPTNKILVGLSLSLRNTLSSPLYKERAAQIEEQYNEIEMQQKGIIKTFLDQNQGSLSCLVALYTIFDGHLLFNPKDDHQIYTSVYKSLDNTFKDNKNVEELKNFILNADKYKEIEDTTNSINSYLNIGEEK